MINHSVSEVKGASREKRRDELARERKVPFRELRVILTTDDTFIKIRVNHQKN